MSYVPPVFSDAGGCAMAHAVDRDAPTRRRMTRRDMLRLAGLSGLGMALLSACGQQAPAAKPAETKPAEAAKPAETKPAAPAATTAPAAQAAPAAKPAE